MSEDVEVPEEDWIVKSLFTLLGTDACCLSSSGSSGASSSSASSSGSGSSLGPCDCDAIGFYLNGLYLSIDEKADCPLNKVYWIWGDFQEGGWYEVSQDFRDRCHRGPYIFHAEYFTDDGWKEARNSPVVDRGPLTEFEVFLDHIDTMAHKPSAYRLRIEDTALAADAGDEEDPFFEDITGEEDPTHPGPPQLSEPRQPPGGLRTGGLSTGSLTTGGLRSGGLSTGSLHTGSLDESRGGLDVGTLQTGPLTTSGLVMPELKLGSLQGSGGLNVGGLGQSNGLKSGTLHSGSIQGSDTLELGTL